MDTSLSDIIEAHGTIDAECMGLSVSQSVLFGKKLTSIFKKNRISTRVYRDDSRSIKSTETSWSSAH